MDNHSLTSQTLCATGFSELEHQINALVEQFSELLEENRTLRGALQKTEEERDQLKEKNQMAMARIESILATVRHLEEQV